VLMLLCAGRSIESYSKPWFSRAIRTAVERSARRTLVCSSHIMMLEQRVPALAAWLLFFSYANIFAKTFPQRHGFLHWCPIMRREAGALNACACTVGVNVYVQVKTIPIRKLVLQILFTHLFLIRIDYSTNTAERLDHAQAFG
jgi:hypothetical protein